MRLDGECRLCTIHATCSAVCDLRAANETANGPLSPNLDSGKAVAVYLQAYRCRWLVTMILVVAVLDVLRLLCWCRWQTPFKERPERQGREQIRPGLSAPALDSAHPASQYVDLHATSPATALGTRIMANASTGGSQKGRKGGSWLAREPAEKRTTIALPYLADRTRFEVTTDAGQTTAYKIVVPSEDPTLKPAAVYICAGGVEAAVSGTMAALPDGCGTAHKDSSMLKKHLRSKVHQYVLECHNDPGAASS